MCPRSMFCPCCQLMGHSSANGVQEKKHTCRCQQVTIVRQPFSSQFPDSQRVRSMKSVSFAMLRAEKAGVFQTTQTLCEEDFLVAHSASGNPAVARNHFAEHQIAFAMPCLSSMPCRCCSSIDGTFVQQSSSYQSPVPNRQHTRRCQAVTTLREPFSSQSPFSQRVRSMNSVSFAMLRAEKAGVFQTTQTLCEEDSLVADAAV